MKAIVLCSLVASTSIAVLTFPPELSTQRSHPPVPHFSAPTDEFASRHGWDYAESQIANDPEGYRARANQEIESRLRELATLTTRCTQIHFASREYLQTRVLALREHLDYARGELLKLPSSYGDPDFTATHAHFHRTLRHLDAAFAQATDEMSDGA